MLHLQVYETTAFFELVGVLTLLGADLAAPSPEAKSPQQSLRLRSLEVLGAGRICLQE